MPIRPLEAMQERTTFVGHAPLVWPASVGHAPLTLHGNPEKGLKKAVNHQLKDRPSPLSFLKRIGNLLK